MEVPTARLCPVHGGVNCSDGAPCGNSLARRFQLPLDVHMGCVLLLADGRTVTELPAAVTSMREQLDVVAEALKSVQRGVTALRVTVGGHSVRLDDVDARVDGTASRVDTVDGSCLHSVMGDVPQAVVSDGVSWCGHRYSTAAGDGRDIASQSAAGAARHCCIGFGRVAIGR
jgi:hypothetical protein